MEKVKEAAPHNKAPAVTQVVQPKLPEKRTGPQLLSRSLAGALPPPAGMPPAARTGNTMVSSESGYSAAGRARMSRAVQRSVGNTRMGEMRPGNPGRQTGNLQMSGIVSRGTLTPTGSGAVQRAIQSSSPYSSSQLTTRPARKPSIQRKCDCGGKAGPDGECAACKAKHEALQRKTSASRASVQRKCACGGEAGPDGECAACKAKREAIQRQETSPTEADKIPTSVTNALQVGGGQPLSSSTRDPMEQSFGADFSGVRVHTDRQADLAATDIQAAAFTHGQDIFFAEGQYQPHTIQGKKLLAHELTHTIQQAERRPELQSAPLVSQPDDPLEREASATTDKLMSSEPVSGDESALPNRLTQRQVETDKVENMAPNSQTVMILPSFETNEAITHRSAVSHGSSPPHGIARIQRYSWGDFTSDLGSAGRAIASVPGRVADTAQNVASSVADTASSLASRGYDTARDVASSAYDLGREAISGAYSTARNVVGGMVGIGSRVAGRVLTAGERVLRTVSRSARTIAESLYGVATSVANTLSSTAQTVGRTLLNAVLAAGRGLLSAGLAIFEAVRELIDTIRNVANHIAEWLQRQAERVIEWLCRRREFHLPDFTIFNPIEHSVSHFDATDDVALASTTVNIPYVGPTVLALFGRGELVATLGIGIGPGMLQNINIILDPCAGNVEGEATLNVPADLEGSLSLAGILAVSANPSCLGEIIRVEGGLELAGTGYANLSLSETVNVTYQEGELDFSHKGSLESCLGFNIDLDALANLYILEYPLLSGQWNLVSYPWDKCWMITWPTATDESTVHSGQFGGSGGGFGGGGAGRSFDGQNPGTSGQFGGGTPDAGVPSDAGVPGGVPNPQALSPTPNAEPTASASEGDAIQRAVIPTSLILRAPIQRANGSVNGGSSSSRLNIEPLADVPLQDVGSNGQGLPAATGLRRAQESINQLTEVGDHGPSFKAAELLSHMFGPTRPVITQHPLGQAQMQAIQNGSPCPVPPNNKEHRGRIQVQGADIRRRLGPKELSWPWAQPTPPTATEATTQLGILRDQLTPDELKERNQAFEKAEAFIRASQLAGGVDSPVSRSFRNRQVRHRTHRVDIEVRTGKAFV